MPKVTIHVRCTLSRTVHVTDEQLAEWCKDADSRSNHGDLRETLAERVNGGPDDCCVEEVRISGVPPDQCFEV